MKVLVIVCVLLFAIAQVQAVTPQWDRIIGHVNSHTNKWTAGHNSRFRHASLEDVKILCGSWKTPPEKKLPVRKVPSIAVPDDFDSRVQWPHCSSIGEIRDQSACGSCWAFGAVEAGTDRICISTNATTQLHLSAQDLNSCCASCGDGCNGGDPSAAWQYFTTTGVVTGGNYGDYGWCSSYSMPWCEHHIPAGNYPACPSAEYATPACPTTCDTQSNYSTSFLSDKRVFASSYSITADPNAIQTEIFTNGPVEGAFSVYADFPTYKSGVYHHVTGDFLGGHAIKILGWGTENGNPYWLVANSWNSDWGDQGYFKILRGSDECGIEDGIVAGLWKSS